MVEWECRELGEYTIVVLWLYLVLYYALGGVYARWGWLEVFNSAAASSKLSSAPVVIGELLDVFLKCDVVW